MSSVRDILLGGLGLPSLTGVAFSRRAVHLHQVEAQRDLAESERRCVCLRAEVQVFMLPPPQKKMDTLSTSLSGFMGS